MQKSVYSEVRVFINSYKKIKYRNWDNYQKDISSYNNIILSNSISKINDIYGHVEGDAALVRIANAMRTACRDIHKRTNITRFGGDEFVIMVCTDDEKIISQLKKKINKCLEQLNAIEASPYELEVCIGVAPARRNAGLEEVLEKADAVLYEEKARLGHVR